MSPQDEPNDNQPQTNPPNPPDQTDVPINQTSPDRPMPQSPPRPDYAANPIGNPMPLAVDIDRQFETPEPGPDPTLPPPVPFATASKRRKLSKKAIAGIVVGSVVLVLAGATAAFAFWYNKPENVIADMFAKSVSQQHGKVDGVYDYADAEAKSSVKINYQAAFNKAGEANLNAQMAVKTGDKDVNLNMSFVASDDRKMFLKVEPLKKLVETMLGAEETPYDSLVTMLDGKWLVVTPKDLQSDEKADKQAECMEKVRVEFMNNKTQQSEIAKLYADHRFITVKKDNGIVQLYGAFVNHYDIGFDAKVFESFVDGVVNTEVFKKVDQCYEGELKKGYDRSKESIDTNEVAEDASKSRVELWVDVMTHDARKLRVSQDDEGVKVSFDSKFTMGEDTDIVPPNADVTVDNLKKEFERVQQEYMDSLSQSNEAAFSDDESVLGAHTESESLIDILSRLMQR